MSPDACNLLEGLLTRDPAKRFGADFNVIKNHPFFEGLDWEKVERKEIEPPFKPQVYGKEDTEQIDPMFTSEQAVDSLVEGSALNADDDQFKGFTYAGESVL